MQRLACAQRVELDKLQSYVREDGAGPTATLIAKVEELQDLLIQQRQTTDVGRLVDKDQTIRQLNAEIARLQDTITEMKGRLQKMVTQEARLVTSGGGQPAELLDHLSVKLKNRETEIDRKQQQITDALVSTIG